MAAAARVTNPVPSRENFSPSVTPSSGKGKPSAKLQRSVKTWNLRLGDSIPVKAVKSHVINGSLPQVSCKLEECDKRLKEKFRRRFSGSLTGADKIGTIHVDTKEKI